MSNLRRLNTSLGRAMAVGGLLVLVACTSDRTPGRRTGTPSGRASPSSGSVASAEPTGSANRSTPTRTDTECDDYCACGGPDGTARPRPYTPDGPAYAGAGPHRIQSFADYVEGDLPARWVSDPTGPPQPPQLVLCEGFDESFKGTTVGTCTYDGTDGPTTAKVESVRYIYRVFEARTAKLVSTFALQSSASAEDSCPASSVSPTSFFQLVGVDALIGKLRPLIEGTRPR